MQRSPAEPNPAGDGCVGGEVHVRVGQHDHVVLRAAEGLHALARRWCRSRRRTGRSGSSRRSSPLRCRGGRGCASTATLSPCTTLKTPSGSPASAQSWARRIDAEGSFSLGLRMKVLPAAIATGNIHIGTMAGKLNGVIPAHHAERLPDRVDVDAGGDLLGEFALEQVRDAAGELDDLKAAGDLARGVRDDLAVLVGDELGQLGVWFLTRSRKANRTRRAWTARRAPGHSCLAGDRCHRVATSPHWPGQLTLVTSPVAGL